MPPSGKKKYIYIYILANQIIQHPSSHRAWELSTSSQAKKSLKYKLSPNQEIKSNYKFFWYLFETN